MLGKTNRRTHWQRYAMLLPATLFAASAAFAASVAPVVVDGNPSCSSLGYDYGFKPQPEPPPSGTYSFPGGSVTISSDGTYFDWTSTIGMDAVIVKGGSNANVYVYDPPPPESTGDTGLHSPVNASGDLAGISHIEFCYDWELTASKTANATFTRTYTWDIDKSVTPSSASGFPGSSFPFDYDVAVDQTTADSNFGVSGVITVINPTPFTVNFSVSDSVDGTPATVNCVTNTLAPGGSTTCAYSAGLAAKTDGTNTATISIVSVVPANEVNGAVATADYAFGDPTTTVGYPTVNVTDSLQGALGSTSVDKIFEYTRNESCPTDGSLYVNGVYSFQRDNTATITETGQSDDASITVTCYAPVVTKTATARYDETHTWSIEKTVDPLTQSGVVGQNLPWTWTVTVNESSSDSNFAVSGTISVQNPHPTASMTVSVADVLNDGTGATVDCGPGSTSLTVAAASTGQCTYTAVPSGKTATLNTATATIGGLSVSGTAAVSFEKTVIGGTATLTDTEIGLNEVLTAGVLGPPWVRTGPGSYTCSSIPADYGSSGSYSGSKSNTANITPSAGVADSDDATTEYTCYAPRVTKTANTSFTRSYTWDILKEGPAECVTLIGSYCETTYDVTVTRDAGTDSGWGASGTITVLNPSGVSMNVVVTDAVNGTPATVNCGDGTGNLTVPANSSSNCSYSVVLGSSDTLTNTATATFNGVQFQGTASVVFGSTPTAEVDECVSVSDDPWGPLAPASVCTTPYTFPYTVEWLMTPQACASRQFVNTATFTTNDTGAHESSSWTVAIDESCDDGFGCTLTQGYWKTHSDRGPAPYDATWELVPGGLGESTLFFLSGQTWYGVLWTAPAGNAYYNLAHQYIAAYLNVLNGASTTPDVTAAMASAVTLFNMYTPAQIAALKGPAGNAVRSQFIALASTLDQYNNGLIGPGHCTE